MGIRITSIIEKYVRPCVLGHILALSHLIFATIIYYPCFVGEETGSWRQGDSPSLHSWEVAELVFDPRAL